MLTDFDQVNDDLIHHITHCSHTVTVGNLNFIPTPNLIEIDFPGPKTHQSYTAVGDMFLPQVLTILSIYTTQVMK